MKIDKILSGIRQSQETTKEASEHSTPAVSGSTKTAAPAAATGSLVNALTSALAAAPSAVKTASTQGSPVADVMKVAEEMAAVEQDAQIKQAQVMGAAFADSFVARLGVWQAKSAELNASAPAAPAAGTSFGKFAAENAGLMSQAQSMGYGQTKAALDKQAEDERVAGYNDTVNAIHKTASVEFLKGAAVMSNVLDAVAG